jgi:hypothetical protein
VNPKLLVVDLLNRKGVCHQQNLTSSKQIKVSFETSPILKAMDRMKAEVGYLHYVNIKNEKTFVHEKQSNNFAYLRKVLIDTKKMVLDLSNT